MTDWFISELQREVVLRGRDLGYSDDLIKRVGEKAREISGEGHKGLAIRPSHKALGAWVDALYDAEIALGGIDGA